MVKFELHSGGKMTGKVVTTKQDKILGPYVEIRGKDGKLYYRLKNEVDGN